MQVNHAPLWSACPMPTVERMSTMPQCGAHVNHAPVWSACKPCPSVERLSTMPQCGAITSNDSFFTHLAGLLTPIHGCGQLACCYHDKHRHQALLRVGSGLPSHRSTVQAWRAGSSSMIRAASEGSPVPAVSLTNPTVTSNCCTTDVIISLRTLIQS